jgi:hypothetical protein
LRSVLLRKSSALRSHGSCISYIHSFARCLLCPFLLHVLSMSVTFCGPFVLENPCSVGRSVSMSVPAPCSCNSTGRYGSVPSTHSREIFGTLTLPRSHSTSSLISSPSLTFACRLHQFALSHASEIAEAVVEQGVRDAFSTSRPPTLPMPHTPPTTLTSKYCLPSVDSDHVVGAWYRPATYSSAAWRCPCIPEIASPAPNNASTWELPLWNLQPCTHILRDLDRFSQSCMPSVPSSQR